MKIGEKEILPELNFSMKGGIHGLLGANGAGKSTFFKVLMGFLTPQRGEMVLDGQSLIKVPPRHRRSLGLGYLAQEPWLFNDLKVVENLVVIAELMDWPKENTLERCHQAMKELGLEAQAQQKAGTLSGGEKRRLELARVNMETPKLILLDEPFAGLDPKAIRQLKDAFATLSDKGVSLLISDHQITHILEICKEVTLLESGLVVLECDAEDFLTDPRAQKSYL